MALPFEPELTDTAKLHAGCGSEIIQCFFSIQDAAYEGFDVIFKLLCLLEIKISQSYMLLDSWSSRRIIENARERRVYVGHLGTGMTDHGQTDNNTWGRGGSWICQGSFTIFPNARRRTAQWRIACNEILFARWVYFEVSRRPKVALPIPSWPFDTFFPSFLVSFQVKIFVNCKKLVFVSLVIDSAGEISHSPPLKWKSSTWPYPFIPTRIGKN